MRDAFIEKLESIAAVNSEIILITGDLGFGVLTSFSENYPDQFINAGVAEQNMTAVATGMALQGCKTFTYSIGNFPTLRCLEQIRNDACYHNANINIIAIGGGFSYGQLGMSHHATEDIAIMRALPNMQVFVPSTKKQAADVIDLMLEHDGPSYLRIDKDFAELEDVPHTISLGKANIISRGDKIVIAATGAILKEAIRAADTLKASNLHCSVIELPSIKPFNDPDAISFINEHDHLISVEEHNIIGGLSSLLADQLLQSGTQLKSFSKIGLPDCYSSVVGDQSYLRQHYKMDCAAIVAKIRSII